ncbi:gtf2h4 [Symbiodinium natans]|uniref:Gtf2h4 protein n=1 Tax=Symbiodinium natans TaxID=878477 RepID=A0A812L2G5_9DINO|nr:gtf2h4 [Symbiodinium natans]
MSSDTHLLQACGKRCGVAGTATKILYVDLVNLQFQEEVEDDALEDAGASPSASAAGPKFGASRKAYVCVGQSCIYLLRSSMSHRLKAFNGQLDYVWLEKVVQDTSSRTRFLVALNDKRPKGSPSQFIIDTENRDALLTMICTNYVSDCLQELGNLESLATFQHSLQTSPAPSRVAPPKGFKSAEFRGYAFFIRQSFQEVPSAISKVSTGHFSTSMGELNLGDRSWGWSRQAGNVELFVNVVDPIPLSELIRLGREHVRWVAMECKASLLKSWDSVVLQNRPYTKKMNLANDISAWSCWQLAVQDKEDSWAIIVLRRQYVAPMMDTVQDFVLALRCPSSVSPQTVQGQLMDEVAIIADSFSPSPHPNLNADVVQAKLDALLYDSEAYAWLHDRFTLQPHGPVDVEKHAMIFVKGVVKSLYNEHVLSSIEVLEATPSGSPLRDSTCCGGGAKEIESRADEICTLAEAALSPRFHVSDRTFCQRALCQDLEPLTVALKLLSHPGQGLPRSALRAEIFLGCAG